MSDLPATHPSVKLAVALSASLIATFAGVLRRHDVIDDVILGEFIDELAPDADTDPGTAHLLHEVERTLRALLRLAPDHG